MIRIDSLYSEFNSMYNTHEAGFYRPYDFVTAVNSISMDLFNRLTSLEGRSEKINTLLEPFYKQANLVPERNPDGAVAAKPKDYAAYSDCMMILQKEKSKALPNVEILRCGEVLQGQEASDFYPDATEYEKVKVVKITPNKRSSVTTHVNRKPSASRPYIIPKGAEKNATEAASAFEILPAEIGVVTIGYYRTPAAAVYKYKEREEGPDTYLDFVAEGSVNLEWSEAMRPVFLYKLGQYYGLTEKDELRLQVLSVDKIFI